MEELVKKAKYGDKKAFTELIISMENHFYKVAKTRLNNEADINEAVQETIIQIFKNIKKIKKIESYKAWMMKILVNNCNTIYRKSKRNSHVELNENYVSEDIENQVVDLNFYMLIKQLNDKEKTALTLYYSVGLTAKEIGKILKEPESTVRNRINRAIKKLREKYEGGVFIG